MEKVRTAIVGVGNCAKSLVETVAFYTHIPGDEVGLMHPQIGPYKASDIDFVAALDVDARKVGIKLHNAINAEPNCTRHIAEPLASDVVVQRGVTHDSVIAPLVEAGFIIESDKPPVDITQLLRDTETQVVLNYLPTGSDEATYAYAEATLRAGASFINCMPTPIAKDTDWQERFNDTGLVLMGDDIKSQLGATIVNRVLLQLLKLRGVRVTESTQVNYGGNADHFNLHHRPHAKEESKGAALTSVIDEDDAVPTASMVYTEKNYDRKEADIRISGEIVGHVPVSLHVKLEDEDSPNSAGVVIDAARAACCLVNEERPEDAKILCASLMKSPPIQLSDSEAARRFNEVLNI